jgi:hypothetical protein
VEDARSPAAIPPPLVYGTVRPVVEPANLHPLGDAARQAITTANPSRLVGARVAVTWC